MKPILRKSNSLTQVRCVDCFNYDKTRQVGYSCLIMGTSRKDPRNWEACFYFIHRTQTRLGTKGMP